MSSLKIKSLFLVVVMLFSYAPCISTSNAKESIEDEVNNVTMYVGEIVKDNPYHNWENGSYSWYGFTEKVSSNSSVVKIDRYYDGLKFKALKPGKAIVKTKCGYDHYHIWKVTVKQRKIQFDISKGKAGTFQIKMTNPHDKMFYDSVISYVLVDKHGKKLSKGEFKPYRIPPQQTMFFGASLSQDKVDRIDIKKSKVIIGEDDATLHKNGIFTDYTNHVKITGASFVPNKENVNYTDSVYLSIEDDIDKEISTVVVMNHGNSENEIVKSVFYKSGPSCVLGNHRYYLCEASAYGIPGYDHTDFVIYGYREKGTGHKYNTAVYS